ncbi:MULTISPECIES: carbohydrate ABC transporter permease [unclassified Ensifer]|uniref:carbohydrate ABC transporter permease n=1 Tax=unclassified Ensifer TaxID=2633371 RepID=UPI00042F62A8|nr:MULTISPECIES: carbohydrate ABC transporter permease [unclassified Ensifer]AHK47262.1 putative sugar ABC transporter, permease protein [Ensifer adhaerens OV14]MBD9491748.1 carbohydrate ABC transporter permease [Ensifer sp. ENS11]MDP9634740.1 multiple sugar transport system permease protein [Ensifer adhaerens]OMQ38832.1 ABC transporter permease [Ensifer sp. 1H6]
MAAVSPSESANKVRSDLLAYASLSIISIFCVVPFFWVLLASFDGNAQLFLQWPKEWTVSNYTKVFVQEDGARWLFNSLFIVGSATILVMVLAGLGGYALSRTRAWWKLPFLYAILLIRVLPPTALVVPLYKVLLALNNGERALLRPIFGSYTRDIMQWIGFIDGYLGLILVLATMQLPLALWIMKTFFDGLPRDYEEAALMDGATMTQRIRRVLIPLALPGLAAAGLFSFMSAWGDFLMPLIFLSSPELQPLPLGLFRAFMRINQVDYGLLAALAFIYLLPAVVAFGFARKFLVQTFAGGVKG